ncbi:cardiolipin synthase [Alkaliphilus serpentinus]|uniref:Cardiolipin synthase n=2 Tax=Alkaliphilus serpentinus TaxID=1482731 RepID=A0A833HP50_9FIRM|nr:cardiolipin synthase [Alkaliphilus serpentinus]
MLKLLQYTLIIILTLLISYNLFRFLSNGIILGVYPYILALFAMVGIFLLIWHFVKIEFLKLGVKWVFLFIIIFFFYTFIQIFRNAYLTNDYQKERSIYMDKLMNITEYRDADVELTNLQTGISTLIEGNTGIPLTYYNEVKVLADGVAVIDEMIETLSKAEDHIHVEYFIIRDDQIGNKFKDVLIKKAKEGVKVRLIYDGLGSRSIEPKFKRKLMKNGVEIGVFNGSIMSAIRGKLNHRNHRKIVVVDGKIGYIGGFNIGDEYLGRDDNIGKWKDLHIKVHGEVVNWAQKIFLGDWYYITKEAVVDKSYFPENQIEKRLPCQMITSGFDTHWNEISQLYFSMIAGAQEKVYIATPYLILNDSLIKALQTAAMRGVEVKLIIPKKPDLFLVGWANESFFNILLKAKVDIYMHKDGFVHSKVLLTDNQIVSIGSANLNTRSLFLDYEANAVIYDEGVAGEVEKIFKEYIDKSERVTYEEYKNPPLLKRLKLWIGKLIIPLA